LDQKTCTWLVHYYNLLGYIHQTLGSNTEAVKHLHKAESVIQEQGTEEAGAQFLVNKANLACVYFHLGDMDKSKGYLEEVERLQRMHPAPPGCTLHPEVSGEKGWTMVKLNKSNKCQAVDYFKMALNAEPDRKEWHKGLAIAMNAEFGSEFTPDEIVQQLKIANEKEPNSLFIYSHWLKLCKEKNVNIEKEMQGLFERTLETGNLECLHVILRYFSEQDFDKGIQKAKEAHEKFPSSAKVLKQLADCYKWKVYKMADSEERETLARESIKLYEKDLTYNPDSYKLKIDIASLHCYTHEIEKADEIYNNLLSEENDSSPHKQQYIFYNYAQHLNHNKLQTRDSVPFYMKAAEIPVSGCKQKSIRFLQNIVRRGTDPRCVEILHFLNGINSD